MAASAIWLLRAPAAEQIAEAILALRGVEADLRVERIDFGRVELAALRIGPAVSPNLTTGALSARLDWRSPWSLSIEDIVVWDPHLRVRFANSAVDWGALAPLVGDRLGAEADHSQAAFLGATHVRGGIIEVDTPGGVLTGRFTADRAKRDEAWRLSARINPVHFASSDLNFSLSRAELEATLGRTGLAGNLRITAPTFIAHGLELGDARATVTLGQHTNGASQLQAAFSAARVRSGEALAEGVTGKAAATLAYHNLAALRDMPGEVRLTADAARTRLGQATGKAMRIRAVLARARAGDTLDLGLDLEDVRLGSLRAAAAAATTRFEGATGLFSDRPQRGRATGVLSLSQASLNATARELLARTLGGEDAPEPFGPLLGDLGGPIVAAAQDFSLTLPVAAELQGGGGSVRLAGPVRLRAVNGVTATWSRADASQPDLAMRLQPLSIAGGGRLVFARNGVELGQAQVHSLRAENGLLRAEGDASLSQPRQGAANGAVRLEDVKLALAPDGQGSAAFRLDAAADGPMAGGRVKNARFAMTATASWSRAGFELRAAEPQCPRLAWTSLAVGQTRFGPLAAGLCPRNAQVMQLQNGRLSGAWRSAGIGLSFTTGEGPTLTAGHLTTGAISVSLAGSGQRPVANIALTAPEFRVGPDGEAPVTAEAPRARLQLMLGDPAGWRLRMDAQAITARRPGFGLVLEDGSLAAALRPVRDGLAAAITDIRARLVDTARPVNIAPLRVAGNGGLEANILTADMTASTDAGRPIGTVEARHDFARGSGSIAFASQPLQFSSGAFEPKSLAPVLQGLLADVSGAMSGHADLAWDGGALRSGARVDFDGLDFVWAGGPAQGMRGSVVFNDIMTPSTPPGQRLTFAQLNPGVPLENAEVTFQVIDAVTLQLEGGVAPFALGALRLEPASWRLNRERQDVVVTIDAIDLGALIRTFKLDDMAGEGRLTGRLPLEITGSQVRIVDGLIEASKNGGVFKYNGPLNRDLPDLPNPRDQLNKLASDPSWVTMKSLEDFRYDELSLRVSGDLAGDIVATGAFRGRNAKVLQGAVIRYDVTLAAPLGRLLSQVKPGRGILGITLPEGALEQAIRLHNEEANPVDGPPAQPR